MSIEVEIKLRISDKECIEETLAEIGFCKGKFVMESDTYYMAEHHDFVGLDEALRVRCVENRGTGERSAVITYKGAKLDNTSMTRQELEIQQYRYRDILEFEINIPKELSGIPVPKLSIQPLAENALYHGIKNRRGKGKILIEGREEEDALVLTVSDNGQGMTPERLHEVQEAIRTGERAGFGLAAVAERIALYYGPGYGMKIFSEEGKGTTVEIRLGKNIQPKS